MKQMQFYSKWAYGLRSQLYEALAYRALIPISTFIYGRPPRVIKAPGINHKIGNVYALRYHTSGMSNQEMDNWKSTARTHVFTNDGADWHPE